MTEPEASDSETTPEGPAQQHSAAPPALETGQDIGMSAEQADELLEGIERLVQLARGRGRRSSSQLRLVATVFVATIAVVSALAFLRVTSTEIEVEPTVQELGFRIPKVQALTSELRLSSISAGGVSEVWLPRARTVALDPVPPAKVAWSGVHLSIPDRSSTESTITLATLAPKAGSRIWLRAMEVPGQYRLSLDRASGGARVNVSGPVVISANGPESLERDFGKGRPIIFRNPSNVMDLVVSPATDAARWFQVPILVDALSFVEVKHSPLRGGSIEVSTILEGLIYFSSLYDEKRTVRARENLRFVGLTGEIRSLEVGEQEIRVLFHGEVRDIRAGSGSRLRSLMPTLLGWLRARKPLYLFWTSAIYLFGLILSAIRCLGRE